MLIGGKKKKKKNYCYKCRFLEDCWCCLFFLFIIQNRRKVSVCEGYGTKGIFWTWSANLPCRHSGIRPQHDPSVKLDSNDGCLQTEGDNQYLNGCFIPQVRFPHMAQRHGISLRYRNTHRSPTYSGFHLLGQPLWLHFFQHGACRLTPTLTTTVFVCQWREGDGTFTSRYCVVGLFVCLFLEPDTAFTALKPF